MSNRTFACVDCGKSYRRAATTKLVKCPLCGQECERVHWKLHIPSPAKKKEWTAFWTKYRREKRLLDQFQRDPRVKEITLDLLNQRWVRQEPLKKLKAKRALAAHKKRAGDRKVSREPPVRVRG